MRRYFIFLVIVLFGIALSSCAGTEPTELEMLEILDSLETEVNEKDMDGVMALFAEDAVVEETYEHSAYIGTKEIERAWKKYVTTPFISDFRDISVDGDTATFTWVEVGTSYTKLWPTIIEVQNGKIIYIDFYEDVETLLTGEE